MVSIRQHAWLGSPADAVWALVGDPSGVHRWVPSLASTQMKGRFRTVTLKRGGEITEEMLVVDPILRRIQYRVCEGLKVDRHLGTVDVIEAGPHRCLLIYSTDIEPDHLSRPLHATITQALARLGEQFSVADSPV